MTSNVAQTSLQDALSVLPKPTSPVEVRERLMDLLRRDLVGAHPDLDPDLDREIISGTSPSTWYLTGFLAPRRKDTRERRAEKILGSAADDEKAEVQLDALRSAEGMEQGAPGPGNAADDGASERPPMRSFVPSSLGLTVLLPRSAKVLQARVTWGDYVTEPPLDKAVFLPDEREKAVQAGEQLKEPPKSSLDWRRIPRDERLAIDLESLQEGVPQRIVVRESAAPQVPGGGLELVVTVRPAQTAGIDGVRDDVLAVSVFLVNARPETYRRFGDIAFCFQARLELQSADGFAPRDDRASYDAQISTSG